jgi:hypothetical protein
MGANERKWENTPLRKNPKKVLNREGAKDAKNFLNTGDTEAPD